jgi:ABC-type nitrate/sulfonate/bicarbonate transport system ATPase subunit
LSPPAAELRGLRHAFPGPPPVPVLDAVSLSVPAHGFVAVLGPSGCGKSTLLRALAGLLVPDEGEVRVAGASVAGRPGAVAFQPQRDLLLPWKRALANATLGAEVAGVPAVDARRQAEDLLERFGLAGFERAWPAELSGGMRQRLALLRTWLTPRPLLALDEPLGALDALTRRDLQGWLEGVWLDDRRATVLVTHDVEEAILLADEVVVLSDRPARVVASLPVAFPRPRPAALVTDPAFVAVKAEVLAALRTGHRQAMDG